MNLADKKILLTGATGLIGGEIYYRLQNKKNITVLCRNQDDAQERLLYRQNVIKNNKCSDNFNIVYGDITKPDWGLKDFEYDIIIHCAADTSFIHKKECHEVNLKGTQYLINLAKASEKNPLVVYIGTASSHGALKNTMVNEQTKAANQYFNEYTKTKRMGEKLIENDLDNFLILSPTIVMADNVEDSKFASYIGWVFYATKFFNEIAFRPDSLMDYIPVSYFGKTVVDLLEKKQLKHKKYIICCGKDKSVEVKSIMTYLDKYFNRKPIEIGEDLCPIYSFRQRVLFQGIKYYLPFANMNVVYDNDRIVSELEEKNECPQLFNYLETILDNIDEKAVLTELRTP